MVRENKTECKMTFRNEEPHVNKCFPRVRGDVPQRCHPPSSGVKFSPRARGCSSTPPPAGSPPPVFPACAGMFRNRYRRNMMAASFPRVRGDVPFPGSCPLELKKFSPRARGCSFDRPPSRFICRVFPACAGMFRTCLSGLSKKLSFPRVRGDVPSWHAFDSAACEFSPRARGCSSGSVV